MTGAAVASAATGVVSLGAGIKSSKNAADSAEAGVDTAIALRDELSKLGTEGVDYAQTMIDDWESTFGGIQDNMASYYQNLDPTKFATQGKSNLSGQLDKQMTQFNDTMAASGLQSAGMQQQAQQEAAFKQAEGNAGIDLMAPEAVNKMQQGFLQFGEGQRTTADSMMNTALGRQGSLEATGANAVMGALGAQTQQYQDSSTGFMGASGDFMGSALGLGLASGSLGGGGAPSASVQGYGANQSGISGPRRPDGML